MEIGLELRSIPFEAQKELRLTYKGRLLKKHFCADLVCFHQIVVELKALGRLTGREESQVLNYLNATGLRVAVLINFGAHRKLEGKRLIR